MCTYGEAQSKIKPYQEKPDFEIWAATFGVKINRYHVENRGYVSQPFRSETDNSNQTITFSWFGSH